ncbi:hypothetical protein EMGBS3_15950 [Anaerolineaceae bacterium]|nr:hypothetical protein EMGBS3_15950 [Anaerolineaceae bacterium]
MCAAHNWRRWGPCVVAGSYDLHPEREYFAVRTSAALFDVSPLYKIRNWRVDATRLLNRVITRDVSRCRLARCFTHRGAMLPARYWMMAHCSAWVNLFSG